MKNFFAKITAFIMSILILLFPSLGSANNLSKDYVTKGSTLYVNLDSNPTTGYSWEAEISDESVIRYSEYEYTPNNSLDGSAGRDSFKFTAVSEGKATLSFSYARHWNHEKPSNTATYEIEVDENCNVSVVSYVIK